MCLYQINLKSFISDYIVKDKNLMKILSKTLFSFTSAFPKFVA